METLKAFRFRSRPGGWLRVAMTAFAIALSGAGPLRAQAVPDKEYQVKAVFLFRFAQFVEWPASAFSEPEEPVVIGVLGDDPFGPYLDGVVRDEKIGERPIVIRRYGRIEDLTDCHILFVAKPHSGRMDRVLEALKNKATLTVGEAEGFSQAGGMIRFATQQTKIRLKINLDVVQAAKLLVSSKLLRLADIVPPGKS